jgi:preprotein translocase subunit SecY
MASAAEQLASSFNLSAFGKATELKRRIWYTLGLLIVFRLGSFIPMPYINPDVLKDFFDPLQGGGLGGMLDMFAGGSLGRMSVFALSIMPYISASIIMQLMSSVVPQLAELKKEGESGRKKINQYTRYGTVLLAAVQAYGIAVGLEHAGAATVGGIGFRLTTALILTTGTMFLMWLGEQITQRGVGNGTSLIIFAGIVARLPSAFGQVLELGRNGEISTFGVLGFLALAVAVIFFIVFMERAQRRIVVQYPKRQVGAGMAQSQQTHLPLKLNTSGVIPPIFASSLLLMPLAIVKLLAPQPGADVTAMGEFLNNVQLYLNHGQPLYMALYAAGIIFFCFFYTAVVFNPEETAENLRKNGGFVPGLRPGSATAEYFEKVLTRLTVIGSAYLVVVCLMPEYLMSRLHLPFYFGGTSLLIVVSVTMDTVAQIHSHLLAHQYEGLIKKARLRGRRG